MIMLHELSAWVLGFADSQWAIVALGLASFSESIFFPIPPDPLLVAMGLIRPNLALALAALVTVTSVAGAVVGHWLGKLLGRPLLLRFASESRVARVEGMFQKYGAGATLLAAFTPIPYKVFAITAGALGLDRRVFVLASIVGRGGRFMTQGFLLMLYGESIEAFISENFELLTLGVSVTLVGAFAVWVAVHRLRRAQDAA